MGLPIKDLPAQLEALVDDWVWPGDEAVDLEASDLDQWVRHGGTAGLAMRPGQEAATIRIGPLSDRAFRRVMTTMQRAADSTYLDEAFRFGCRRIRSSGARIRLVQIDGIQGLDDATLDALGSCEAVIPWGHLHVEMLRAMSADDIPDPATLAPSPTTLPVALGMVVLTRTFRARRGRA